MRKSWGGLHAPPTENGEDGAGSTVRLLRIPRAAPTMENYGFHLTRSKWDPYPWVCEVAAGTPAALCGLKPGDCVLEVNGLDVLGLRVAEIAKMVKSQKDCVTILCWNSECEKDCDNNSICCAPMPTSLRRLSLVLESILRLVECPVCGVTISPPAMQCQNGHLLCVDCRIRSERCPVCRDFYTPQRSLLAEQIFLTIANAFEMCRSEDKLRQKLFAGITRPVAGKQDRRSRITGEDTWRKRRPVLPTNKFLTKLLEGCAYSMDNLTASNAATLLRTSSMDGDGDGDASEIPAGTSPLTATPPERATMHAMDDGNAAHPSLSTNDLQREGVKPSAEGGDKNSETDSSHKLAASLHPSQAHNSHPPIDESSGMQPFRIPPATPSQDLPQQVVQTKPALLMYRCPCELQDPEDPAKDRHQNCCYKSAFRLL
ncbi:LOW QUALITY PROTEIN: uncharacterized protein LOC108052242 [Drosophila rhopaloa]|uniref:E3 ubiquitin-protein ligase sinah n=1 Tax=Drosophila rhopaloa TaxID=1041015 RepID=A0ABM5I4R9_DRORH|nr:LOW QUALITY PROTEIN: uncharacterized protein LOC108052242 [Drosophila rhopaloa]